MDGSWHHGTHRFSGSKRDSERKTLHDAFKDAQWKGTNTATQLVGATKNSTERNKMKPEDLEIRKR
jgi:hypothetical protein